MERIALSSYSKLVKVVILVGIPFFFLMGAMCVWLALTDPPSNAAVAIFITMTCGFAGMGWFGLRLLPFLHSSCAALETLVAEDCDRCGNCTLACPQEDPTIKHYLVQTHLAEGMAELLAKASTEEVFTLDLLLSAN